MDANPSSARASKKLRASPSVWSCRISDAQIVFLTVPPQAQKKLCRAGKHTVSAANTGERGRCLDCKRDYQREFMRAKRQREQLGDYGMGVSALRKAVKKAAS